MQHPYFLFQGVVVVGKGGYRHLSIEERIRIQVERKNSVLLQCISVCLGRTPATLSRELVRNSVERRVASALIQRQASYIKANVVCHNPAFHHEDEIDLASDWIHSREGFIISLALCDHEIRLGKMPPEIL